MPPVSHVNHVHAISMAAGSDVTDAVIDWPAIGERTGNVGTSEAFAPHQGCGGCGRQQQCRKVRHLVCDRNENKETCYSGGVGIVGPTFNLAS